MPTHRFLVRLRAPPIPIPPRCGSRRWPRQREWRSAGVPSCSARSSRSRAGPPRRSTCSRPRAATCGATWSASAAPWACRSAGPTLSPTSLAAARIALIGHDEGWGVGFHPERLHGGVRRRAEHLGPRCPRRHCSAARPRSDRHACPLRNRREQGEAAGSNGRGAAAGYFRSADLRHGRRRAVLGQRPARASAGLGEKSGAARRASRPLITGSADHGIAASRDHSPFPDPRPQRLPLRFRHPRLVAERHDLGEHRLLLDLARRSVRISSGVSNITPFGASGKASLRRPRRMALDAVLLDDRMNVGECDLPRRPTERAGPVAGDERSSTMSTTTAAGIAAFAASQHAVHR